MLPAAKRGPHTNGLSPPNGRSTPVIRKLTDEVLYWVAVVSGLGGGGHLSARPDFCLARQPQRAADRFTRVQKCDEGIAVHVHRPWGRPIAQTAGTGRRSSTSTLSTENPPSRSRSASSFPRSRARSGAEWRASQKR